MDLATFIETALTEVCFSQEPLEPAVDRYFAPGYTQRTDGELSDRDGFIRHIEALRALTRNGTVKVHEAVQQGDRIADRHEVTVTKRDGSTSRIEVYLFGQLAADGRLQHVTEVSRVLDGAQEDAGLAKVR